MEFVDRDAAAIGRANQRANASAGNQTNRNAFLFEDLQNSNVSDPAGKTATER
jgi:hypothetical protein